MPPGEPITAQLPMHLREETSSHSSVTRTLVFQRNPNVIVLLYAPGLHTSVKKAKQIMHSDILRATLSSPQLPATDSLLPSLHCVHMVLLMRQTFRTASFKPFLPWMFLMFWVDVSLRIGLKPIFMMLGRLTLILIWRLV